LTGLSRKILLLAVLLLASSPSAFALCSVGGQCGVGNCPFYDWVVDGGFENSCPNFWAYSGSAHREHYPALCGGGISNYDVAFDSSSTNSSVFTVIQVPNSGGTQFQLGYHLEIKATTPSWWDQLTVTIRDYSGTILEIVAVHHGSDPDPNCTLLGGTLLKNYRGQTVKVQFDSTISNPGTVFRLDGVAFWQHN
jgi:hypothetical protein